MFLVLWKERKPQTTEPEVTFFFFLNKCSSLGLAFHKGKMADSIFVEHIQKVLGFWHPLYSCL